MYMHRSKDCLILNPNGEDTLRINEPHVKQMILEHSRRVFELREQEHLCVDKLFLTQFKSLLALDKLVFSAPNDIFLQLKEKRPLNRRVIKIKSVLSIT